MSLLTQVLDPNRRCVDLSNQGGGLTAGVLESLQIFLRHNDHYVHLCISDNLLSSEAITVLCSIIRQHLYLTILEAQHCGLLDKDFRFYIGPAIMTMSQLTCVDLSRNWGLTDASAETLARILLETNVETLRLFGTSLTESGGRVIATAASNTTTLVTCALPFTVGTAVLEDIEMYTHRNRAHRARVNDASEEYKRLEVRPSRLPCPKSLNYTKANAVAFADDLPAVESKSRVSPLPSAIHFGPKVGYTEADQQWRARIHNGRKNALIQTETRLKQSESSSVPSLQACPSAVATASPKKVAWTESTQPTSLQTATPRDEATHNSFGEVTMWDWVDPVMRTTFHCLYLLDSQDQLAHNRVAAVVKASNMHRLTHSKPSRATGGTLHLPYL
ncbi:hypothetical protein, conserved [Leishmania tarentolae]|uniref:Leucine-rich repeat protein n=1 Tax=Leishmania tarentolae TaxID=5689 RepID=A0A640KTL2_LEITA|nr:hypothetical protein, conserved [Leishmania tarentolae]